MTREWWRRELGHEGSRDCPLKISYVARTLEEGPSTGCQVDFNFFGGLLPTELVAEQVLRNLKGFTPADCGRQQIYFWCCHFSLPLLQGNSVVKLSPHSTFGTNSRRPRLWRLTEYTLFSLACQNFFVTFTILWLAPSYPRHRFIIPENHSRDNQTGEFHILYFIFLILVASDSITLF